MLTKNQVESLIKNVKYQKTIFFFGFTQLVFKLLSGQNFDWIWTVRLPCDILTETYYITKFGHLVVNA